MTWASASGGGGEKIGEVRMFVGRDNIPDGWEEIGLSVNNPFDNVWSVAPTFTAAGVVTDSTSGINTNSSAPSIAIAGSGAGMSVVCRNNPYSLGFQSLPRALNLSTGVASAGVAALVGNYAAISERLPSGEAFFASGYATSNVTATNAVVKIDSDLVVTTLAPSPGSAQHSAGGFISSDELAFFGGGAFNTTTGGNLAYAYNHLTNTWRQLANSPYYRSAGAVMHFGTGIAYIVGSVSVADSRVVSTYNPLTNTYGTAPWVWPGGVTGVGMVSCARLPSGKHLVLARRIELGNAGVFTNTPRAYVVSESGPEYEVKLPRACSNEFITLVRNGYSGDAPIVMFTRVSGGSLTDGATLAHDGAYFFEENSFEFLSKSAIVYARKLP